MSQIIEHAGLEFGAVGEGFGPSDVEVKFMSQHYRQPKAGYWVALVDGQVAGCGGIACLDPANGSCELRKLFVSAHYRGRGIGKALALHCLQFATEQAYQQCYLGTLSSMKSAIHLYTSLGFKRLVEPFCGSIHDGCDVWMLKSLAMNADKNFISA
ncbi:GNAT family N-acetyltransferase [Agarivorans sp. QJM3NY_25]|uniref:GNAT family N-acetyltransferase n=1 Tax=Agarivorans sp. QJM3NY_25 TaxID=3421430 RepID=UPI003D7C6B6E